MKNNFGVVKALVKLRLSHLMVFRFSFFSAFFVDGSLFLMQLIMFNAIYANVDSIGGWGRGEVTIFIGTFSLINAINMAVYFFGVVSIPDKIKNGNLDYYITKPGNSLLRLSLENINPGSIPLILFSILIVIYGCKIIGGSFTVGQVLGYTAVVILMTILYYDIEVIIRTTTFFVLSNVNVSRVEELIELCMKVPGVLFKGAFKVLFYFLLPYGIIATIPTQILSNTISMSGVLYGIGICILFTVLTLSYWKCGLKHYNSASS